MFLQYGIDPIYLYPTWQTNIFKISLPLPVPYRTDNFLMKNYLKYGLLANPDNFPFVRFVTEPEKKSRIESYEEEKDNNIHVRYRTVISIF